MKIKSMTRISLFASVLAISVYLVPPIQIPMIEVSFTLQTMVIVLIGFLLTPLEAFLSVLIYILIGAVGLPVFSGARGGFSVLFGPSGGFLILFPLVSLGISLLKSNQKKTGYHLLVAFMISVPILYLLANMYLSFILKMNYWVSLLSLLPLVPLDMIKILLAYFIYLKIPKHILE